MKARYLISKIEMEVGKALEITEGCKIIQVLNVESVDETRFVLTAFVEFTSPIIIK